MDNGRDFLEWHVEEIVQNEGKSLRWAQSIQYDQQCKPHRVGEQRFILCDRIVSENRRLSSRFPRFLAARFAVSQHVEAYACDDGREPRPHVLDTASLAPAKSEPRLLHRVLSVTCGAKYPIRYGLEMGAVILEPIAEPFLLMS